MKRTQKLVTWGIVILVVLVVLLMLVSNLRRSSRVVLPDTNTSAEGGGDLPAEGGALTVVEVTPETVQAAIETLHRPDVQGQHGRDIDQRAAIVLRQAGQDGVGQTHQRRGVQGVNSLMLRHLAREERCHLRGARVVNERINGGIAAQLFFHGADPGFIGEIGNQNIDGHAIARAQVGGEDFQAILATGDQHQVSAARGKAVSIDGTDPGRGTRNQGCGDLRSHRVLPQSKVGYLVSI